MKMREMLILFIVKYKYKQFSALHTLILVVCQVAEFVVYWASPKKQGAIFSSDFYVLYGHLNATLQRLNDYLANAKIFLEHLR